jgi:hypothetical protein
VNFKTKTIMKKLLFLICALFMVGVSQAQTPQTQPQQKVWKVGDVYNVNGKKGVVFTVSPDGQHGVIISLKSSFADWDSGKYWCSSLGSGWRMPNMHELQLIYAVKHTLNEALYWAEGSGLFEIHWSSSLHERNTNMARTIDMSSGLTSYDEKNTKSYVRAVSSF